MNPPPPIPHEYGSTTPSTAAAATAASMALPPRRMTSIAARVATGSTVAAAPPVPTAVGVFGGGVAAGAAAVDTTSGTAAITAATRNRRMTASYPAGPTQSQQGVQRRLRTVRHPPSRTGMAAEPTTTPRRIRSTLPRRIRRPVVGSAVALPGPVATVAVLGGAVALAAARARVRCGPRDARRPDKPRFGPRGAHVGFPLRWRCARS